MKSADTATSADIRRWRAAAARRSVMMEPERSASGGVELNLTVASSAGLSPLGVRYRPLPPFTPFVPLAPDGVLAELTGVIDGSLELTETLSSLPKAPRRDETRPPGAGPQRVEEGARVGEARVAVARERPRDDLGDPLGHGGVVDAHVLRVVHADVDDDLLVGGAGVRRPPREALVEDGAHRPEIRSRVDVGLGLGLLRRHVEGRAQHRALAGERVHRRLPLAAHLGDAEVEDLGEVGVVVAIDQEDVVGLEIAVDDARLVGAVEAAEDQAPARLRADRAGRSA